MVDTFIGLVASLPAWFALGIFEQVKHGKKMTLEQSALSLIYGLKMFVVINGWLLAKQGQTIGKRLAGTRIIGLDGNLCSFKHIFVVRYLLFDMIYFIPIIGSFLTVMDSLLVFRSDRRCFHDLVAKTIVVKDWWNG